MRLFIAVLLPEEIREKLAGAARELSSTLRGIKWVEKENIHLTMKFLGEVSEARLDELKKWVGSHAEKFGTMPSKISEIGAFPNAKRPRVIWAGVEENSGQLRKISEGLEQVCAENHFGKAERRTWSVHVTLGRVREPGSVRNLGKALEKIRDRQFGDFAISELALMKSSLSPKGPTHEKLASFPLQGK